MYFLQSEQSVLMSENLDNWINEITELKTYKWVIDFKSSKAPSGITEISFPWRELQNNIYRQMLSIVII